MTLFIRVPHTKETAVKMIRVDLEKKYFKKEAYFGFEQFHLFYISMRSEKQILLNEATSTDFQSKECTLKKSFQTI